MTHYFFMGIAGAGMSALAQYMAGKGHKVSGSDRQFSSEKELTVRSQLEDLGIKCYPQDGSGLHKDIDIMVVSSAVEPDVPEYKKAIEMGIRVMMRSDLLAEIANRQRTIAVAGTSGKSTVAAMIYEIFEYARLSPSLITGAGLQRLRRKGQIGNAVAGKSDILIIEADESDGSLVKYKPEIGLILNVEKDHKPLEELYEIFTQFAENTRGVLITNRQNAGSMRFSKQSACDFMTDNLYPENPVQSHEGIEFELSGKSFKIKQIGLHTAENAAAAVAAALSFDISPAVSARALRQYEGIDRRHQIIGTTRGISVIDDYAHNPAKLAASLKACQALSRRVFLWFQPHGYGPLRLLRDEFVKQLLQSARPKDRMIFSDVYYAGGSVAKDISSKDLITDLQNLGINAKYLSDRSELPNYLKGETSEGDIILLCGARDPSLGAFAKDVFENL